MIRLPIIILIMILTLSCSSTKEPYVYQICVKREADASLMTKNDMIGIADTSVAFLSGYVLDQKSNQPIGFANVVVSDLVTGKNYGTNTDTLGYFSFTAPSGYYKFEVNYVGLNTYRQELSLKNGELREIEVELGQGEAFVTFEVTSESKLSRRRLNKKDKELEIRE